MLKVTHIIAGLEVGGAEMALYRLLRQLSSSGINSNVISLIEAGPVAPLIESLDVPVSSTGLSSALSIPGGAFRLIRRLRSTKPDVVQTWMSHAGLWGGVAARLTRVPAVAWNLRQSNVAAMQNKATTDHIIRLASRLSHHIPDVIVCGSNAVKEAHALLGYPEDRMVVIPNGFSLPKREEGMRDQVRHELGIGPDAVTVIRVGRFHPDKDPKTLVAAATMVARLHPKTEFILVGPGTEPDNRELSRVLGLTQAQFHLLGGRRDVDRLLMAADIACSSSATEGFPNVVGEAMAAGLPVVATDVGDTRTLVGEAGVLVPPRDPGALARGMISLIEMSVADRTRLGTLMRSRIADGFTLEAMADRYASTYEELASRVRHQRAA